MQTNETAPFEGQLVWKGETRTGHTRNGDEWQSVEFVLKYTTATGKEDHIMFSAFGIDKVNTILATEIGAKLRVTYSPTAREYNGKWFGKNNVWGVYDPDRRNEPQPAGNTAPAPNTQTELPPSAPAYQPQATGESADDDSDLPF